MIEVRLENKTLPDRLRKLAARLAHPGKALADLGGHWQRRVKGLMRDKPPGQAAAEGQPPAVHTSEYAHSILYDVASDEQSMELGSSSNRARILNLGGVIRPRDAKALAVPIAVASYGKRPRDFAGLHFIPPHEQEPEDRGVLGIGDWPAFTPLFALRAWVRIRPHPHIEIVDGDWDYLGGAIERQADRELGIGGGAAAVAGGGGGGPRGSRARDIHGRFI